MDIEEVAEKTPELILKEYVDPGIGLQAFQARKIAFGLGLEGAQIGQAVKLLQALYGAFIGSDASLVEINPLIVTKERQPARARRQGDLRRQRDVPPQGLPGAARHRRGGSARGRGVEVLAELHPARRHHRLHGQRRRPGHGDDGHHQAGRRRAGQLPRRRRRRQRRADQERLPHPDVGHQRQGRADQHLRRHPALRRPRRGPDRRGQGPGGARCRSSSAWKAPTSSRARRCSPPADSTSRRPIRWARPRRRSSPSRSRT